MIAAFVAFLGETGLRKQEGLTLQWRHINRNEPTVAVENTKSRKARYVPLSDFAIEVLDSLPKVAGCPYVFIREESGDRWRKPEGPMEQGRKKAGLDWVTFHDLRHFRATQWVIGGIDIRTVQELLGHSSIAVTMRYAHYAPDHASKRVIEVQRLEAAKLTGEKQEDNAMFNVGQEGTCANSLDSLAL